MMQLMEEKIQKEHKPIDIVLNGYKNQLIKAKMYCYFKGFYNLQNKEIYEFYEFDIIDNKIKEFIQESPVIN